MEEAVVGAVIGASIQVLLQNLLSFSFSHDQIDDDFRKDLEEFQDSFLMVTDFLCDAESKQVNSKAVKRWLRKLQDLAFEAENVFDEFSYRILQPKTAEPSLTNKLQSLFLGDDCNTNTIEYHQDLGLRIRDINHRLDAISIEATRFGLQNIGSAHAPAGSGADESTSRETNSYSKDLVFLGRENDMSRIVEMLTTTGKSERVLSVLPIVGMGGLGKTTLARKVFGDPRIISHFGENRVWVYVSQNFNVRNILKNILTTLTRENVELGTTEALLQKLQKYLGTKRYLLVLDDNWNREGDKWDDLVNSLSGISSATGNCMIVTTRSHEVASIVKTCPIHELQSLSEDDCWSIIKLKAFDKEDGCWPLIKLKAFDKSEEPETVGRNIAKRCQGLPFVANLVGGILCNKSRDEWLSFENNWISNFGDGNPISKILKLSFDNLSSPSLKKCFAYCSIFSKGREIGKEELIELWMAEGFLQMDQKSNNMETTGNKFFHLLLQNSLLQIVKKDSYDNATHCNMHDFVHDLACSISGEDVTGKICQNRYIGYSSSGDIESLSIPKEQARYVRTLFFNAKVSDMIRLSDLKSLHTLTLIGEDIDDLPTSIRELIHLRYLDTRNTRIRNFPDSVGELYHLQTLRAYCYLEKLPSSIKFLIQLRHLHVSSYTVLPPEIGKLSYLRTLPHFHVGHEKGYRISELGSLKNLIGELVIHNLEKVRDKSEAMSADLIRKSDVYKLKFNWNVVDKKGGANDESVLEGLQPHPNLKSLEIRGFRGKGLPSWTLNMAVQDEGLENLMEIKLEDCWECEELPMLGQLPHLKFLYLSKLKNVRYIGSSFYNIGNCRKSSSNSNNGVCKSEIFVFPALERFELSDMPNLTEWAEVELQASEEGDQTQVCQVVVFPCLEYLEVQRCRQLISAPSHFPCLKRLSIHEMESGLPFQNICGVELSSLTHLKIRGIKGLKCLPDGLFSNNSNLLELWISECSNLSEIPEDLHSLNSLETLRMIDCPNLKSIGGHESQIGFTSLRQLEIIYCEGLTDLPIEMVESCAPSLEELSLWGLSSNLKSFPMVIACLHRMPRLTELYLFEVPKFSSKEIVSLSNRSLRFLGMGTSSSSDSSSSWDNGVSFNEAVHAILQASKFSLFFLALNGMEHWESLPDQIQHLTPLSVLWLGDFGIEALPEWFKNLASLKTLTLRGCKRLRHLLPSKEAMQSLAKLTELNILNWECLPDEIQHLTSLSVLRLGDFTIEALPQWFGNLTSLRKLYLENGINLRHLPSREAMQRLTKLTDLSIKNCPLLLKDTDSICERTQNSQIDDSEWHKISHIPNVSVDY